MSCFGGRDDQIYLVEVLIDKLQLTPAKIKDIGEQPVMIKIRFLDFPVFEITRKDFQSLTLPPPSNKGIVNFSMGRSCLFIRKPKDLVQELRTATVGIGVFCVGDTYPLAESSLRLPGCFCDQVAMSTNDPENMPKPYSVKGGFHLLDPGENPSGTLDMEMKITCFGRFITTRYELRPNFFIFKKQDDDLREFCVERNIPPHFRDELAEANIALPQSVQDKLAADAEAKLPGQRKRDRKKGKKKKK
ncbi:hypothetical protein KPH14_005788 [Odynerus spinipes]|uniref:Uncharacterized protein n=1 Tax=Odynerus spinipes TaxID=1348599 RepID=A0AAD9RB27_9HYME|nr:hypothetical protein KPH14_005788 [Odynerus spinipes]